MAVEDVLVQIGAEISGLTNGVDQAKAKLNEITATTSAMNSAFDRLGQMIIGAFSIAAIEQFISKMSELGVSIERSSAMLGVSTTSFQELAINARMAGGSSESMAIAIERLQVNLQRASNVTSLQAQALKALGLSASQLIGLPVDKQMAVFSDALAKFADGGNKTAAVMLLMGRGAAQMIPLLDQGGAGLREMATRAEEATAVLTTRTVNALTQTHQATTLLTSAITSFGASIMEVFSPAVIAAANALTGFISNLNALVLSGNLGEMAMTRFAAMITDLALRIIRLAVVMADALSLNWDKITSDWEHGTAQIEKVAAESAQRIVEITQKSRDAYQQLLTDMAKPLPKPPVPAIDVDIAKQAAERMKLIDLQYTHEVEMIDFTYGKFVFNESAKTSALMSALEQRHTQELAVAGLTAGQRLIIDQKYANDRLKIIMQAAKEEEAAWNTAFSGIQSAFNSQLRGLLAGTTTWTQAFKSMMGDMLIFFIEQIEKMAFEWLAHQLVMTAVTQTGVAARSAAEQAGSLATLPTRVARFTSDVTADAARVFSGIFADLSFVMGPAAAGPAAAGQASVLAEMANVPKLELGTNYVPFTGMAMLHQGEAVIPAALNQFASADTMRAGGTSISVNIQAIDSQSIANMLQGNKAVITQILQKISRDNPKVFGQAVMGLRM